jgi:hypothetical protein
MRNQVGSDVTNEFQKRNLAQIFSLGNVQTDSNNLSIWRLPYLYISQNGPFY